MKITLDDWLVGMYATVSVFGDSFGSFFAQLMTREDVLASASGRTTVEAVENLRQLIERQDEKERGRLID